ncbi:hypothetical protein ABZ805_20885 [Saccharopolyspora sp. NPDC047091]|uniref:hypothetical protein n=1 Tax=Saccharopolyspora sp. NPDC047091 TaxID=3155924 RepID=UPI0034038220
MIIPIPVGPQPPPNYIQVSPSWARKVKTRLVLLGLILLVGSPVIAVAAIWWAFELSAAENAAMILVSGLCGLSGFFSMMVGGFALIGQSYVKRGWLNVTYAAGVWRASLVIWISCVFFGFLSGALFILLVGASVRRGGAFGMESIACLGMMVLPAVLSGMCFMLAIHKLRV